MRWYGGVDNTFRSLGITHAIVFGDGDSLKRIINSNNKGIKVFVVKTVEDAQSAFKKYVNDMSK